MKFNQFTLRQLLASTDYLVGYSNTGEYIRISKDDLIDSMQYPEAEDLDINVQYSVNASSWHNTLTIGDRYIRFRVNDYSWTVAINVQTLVHDSRTVIEQLEENLSSYDLVDDSKRKVFSVSIKDNATFNVTLKSYEECGLIVKNSESSDINISFTCEDADDVLGDDTVTIGGSSKVWISMQRVDLAHEKYIIIKKTDLQ